MKLWLAAALAALAAILLLVLGPPPEYTPDGYTYGIVMLMDRGVPMVQAEREAAAFFKKQPTAAIPAFLKYAGKRPEYWGLFRVRGLDSLLAAPLYPWHHFEALVDISRFAYVLTAVFTVLLVALFAPNWLALLFSIGLSLFPYWRGLARMALTDALAIALTTATLYLAVRYIRSEKRSSYLLAAFAVVCGLLTFTRPVTYIIDAGLLVALIFDRSLWKLFAISVGWTVLVMICASFFKTPDFSWLVRDTYNHFVAAGYAKPGEPLWRWYASEEWTIFKLAATRGAMAIAPIIGVIGMIIGRDRRDIQILAGASVGTWAGAIVDPNHFDMMRCVALPVAPAILACAAFALTQIPFPKKLGLSA